MSIFTKTVRSKLPSNVFKDLSYSNKMDMQIGYLYPVEVEEIVPGDIFSLASAPWSDLNRQLIL